MERILTECPECGKEKFREDGSIWLEQKHLRISYHAECIECGHVLDYDDVVYEF